MEGGGEGEGGVGMEGGEGGLGAYSDLKGAIRWQG